MKLLFFCCLVFLVTYTIAGPMGDDIVRSKRNYFDSNEDKNEDTDGEEYTDNDQNGNRDEDEEEAEEAPVTESDSETATDEYSETETDPDVDNPVEEPTDNENKSEDTESNTGETQETSHDSEMIQELPQVEDNHITNLPMRTPQAKAPIFYHVSMFRNGRSAAQSVPMQSNYFSTSSSFQQSNPMSMNPSYNVMTVNPGHIGSNTNMMTSNIMKPIGQLSGSSNYHPSFARPNIGMQTNMMAHNMNTNIPMQDYRSSHGTSNFLAMDSSQTVHNNGPQNVLTAGPALNMARPNVNTGTHGSFILTDSPFSGNRLPPNHVMLPAQNTMTHASSSTQNMIRPNVPGTNSYVVTDKVSRPQHHNYVLVDYSEPRSHVARPLPGLIMPGPSMNAMTPMNSHTQTTSGIHMSGTSMVPLGPTMISQGSSMVPLRPSVTSFGPSMMSSSSSMVPLGPSMMSSSSSMVPLGPSVMSFGPSMTSSSSSMVPSGPNVLSSNSIPHAPSLSSVHIQSSRVPYVLTDYNSGSVSSFSATRPSTNVFQQKDYILSDYNSRPLAQNHPFNPNVFGQTSRIEIVDETDDDCSCNEVPCAYGREVPSVH